MRHRYGRLAARVRAAEALLESSARTLEEVGLIPSGAEAAARGSLAVAAAKAFGSEVALEAGSELFTGAAWVVAIPTEGPVALSGELRIAPEPPDLLGATTVALEMLAVLARSPEFAGVLREDEASSSSEEDSDGRT